MPSRNKENSITLPVIGMCITWHFSYDLSLRLYIGIQIVDLSFGVCIYILHSFQCETLCRVSE